MPPFARWPLPLLASPACIFHSVSPPAWLFRRWRRGICLLLHAGRCRSSLCRRAFLILFLRRRDRFDDGGEEFASFCPLAAGFLRLAGVHFLSRFSAGPGVSTLPACIFHPVSPPTWSFRRCRGGICLLLHAGRYRSSPCRRAFLILFLRRRDCFDDSGEEFASFCTLAAAVLRFAGVHFLFCFSAGMVVSTVAWRNLPPFARWSLPFFALPACIFHSISPPVWSFRRCRGGICLLLHAGRWLCSPRRRAFFILFLRRHGCFDDGGEEFVSFCTLAAAFLHLAGVQKGAVGK